MCYICNMKNIFGNYYSKTLPNGRVFVTTVDNSKFNKEEEEALWGKKKNKNVRK